MGTVESIMWDQVDEEPSSYCNTFLEEYARDLCVRLLDSEAPVTDWKHMYKGADSARFWIDIDGNRKDAPYEAVTKEAANGCVYHG